LQSHDYCNNKPFSFSSLCQCTSLCRLVAAIRGE
jgi:hypothetical protein